MNSLKSHLTFQTSKHNELDINLHIPNSKPNCIILYAFTVPPTLAPGGPTAPALPGRPRGPLSPRSPCEEIHKKNLQWHFPLYYIQMRQYLSIIQLFGCKYMIWCTILFWNKSIMNTCPDHILPRKQNAKIRYHILHREIILKVYKLNIRTLKVSKDCFFFFLHFDSIYFEGFLILILTENVK